MEANLSSLTYSGCCGHWVGWARIWTQVVRHQGSPSTAAGSDNQGLHWALQLVGAVTSRAPLSLLTTWEVSFMSSAYRWENERTERSRNFSKLQNMYLETPNPDIFLLQHSASQMTSMCHLSVTRFREGLSFQKMLAFKMIPWTKAKRTTVAAWWYFFLINGHSFPPSTSLAMTATLWHLSCPNLPCRFTCTGNKCREPSSVLGAQQASEAMSGIPAAVSSGKNFW